MNLHRTENGLEVHHGGIPNDREIGPERELAIALNHVAKASRQMVAFAEILFWRLPAKDRAEILGVSSRTERRIRRDRVVRDVLEGRGDDRVPFSHRLGTWHPPYLLHLPVEAGNLSRFRKK